MLAIRFSCVILHRPLVHNGAEAAISTVSPNIVTDQPVKQVNVAAEEFVCLHIGTWITIVDAIKWIEFDCECLEMSGQESGIDAQPV